MCENLLKPESVKSRAWRACELCVFTCFACLHAYVLACLACFHAWRAWRAYVLGVLACLRAYVVACQRASVLGVLTCAHACYDEMFYFLTCLRTWCICTWCAFLSYLLYISTLKFKNSCSEKFVCFVKLNIFLIYILIPTYKTI